MAAQNERTRRKKREERAANIRVERFIYDDSRKSDKLAGRGNDLTKEDIVRLVADGCRYCGETSLRMTLDRQDNAIGHFLSNVVPSCVRCNLTRGNMPYKAWLIVAKAMREARESGAFEGWTGPRVGAKQRPL